MVRNKELARKAVRLLLRKLPKDKESLIGTGDFISLMAELYKRSKDMRNFFVAPEVPHEKKLSLLKAFMDKFGVPSEAVDVFDYLVSINALSLLSEMKRLYDHEVEKIMKMSKGYLYLASPMEEGEIKKIVDSVEKFLNRELEVEVLEDKSLIGGFLFKTSGFVVDVSVKRQLEALSLAGGR